MTPLSVIRHAESFFAHKPNGVYFFAVPDDKSLKNFPANIRELAKARGYKWRVAWWGSGRTFLIKTKVIK